MNISNGFTYLPDCIYTSIQTYLTQDDYQQLLNTSKKEFHLLRKKTILFHLTESYSIKYCEDENFRYELLEKIENPLKQIRIKLHYTNIKYYKDLFDLCPVPLICTLSPFYEYEENISLPHVKEFTITDLHHEGVDGFDITAFINFNHCKKVILLKCSAIVDISPLKDCDYIELGNCQNVRDFSSLGRQKTLIIEGNDYLTNIMNLHSIRRLILDQCYNVEDVSPLHGVYDLSLKCCRAVADISSLGGHHRLEISDCCPVLFGYLALRDIPIVELCGCNISDVSVLSNAKVVYLESCNDIVDVSSLRRVKELTLSYCSKIEDISMLTTVRKLTLCRLPHLKKFDGINQMKNLCLRLSTSQDVMLERFPNVRSIECPIKLHLPFFPSFTNLHSLTLSHAKFISPITIDVSVDIHTVILQYCIVKNISGLGKNRVVQFLECGGNELDVSNLATVSLVSFIKCRFTDVNYESLINVPRLKIDPLSITQ